MALQIQEELVDRHMEFTRTAAGEEIRRGLDKHADALEEKIKDLQSVLEDAEKKEQETQRELEREIRKLRAKLEDVRAESVQMEAWYQETKAETQPKTDAMMGDMLKTLFGVFKLGLVSGLLLSTLLGLVPSDGIVHNMVRSYLK